MTRKMMRTAMRAGNEMRPSPSVILLLALVLTLLAVPLVRAGTLGVSPISLNFEDVLRDGYAEKVLIVTTSINRTIPVYANATGEVADWLYFLSEQPDGSVGHVRADEPLFIPIAVTPPSDLATGDYEGYVLIQTGDLGEVQGSVGSTIRTSVLAWAYLDVTGEEKRSCSVGGIRVQPTETGMPIELSLVVKNTGNVRLYPEVQVDVWDQLEEHLLLSDEMQTDLVLPTTREDFRLYMDHELPLGQYWGLVSVPECGYSQLHTFDVLPLGGIHDQGTFDELRAGGWSTAGDLVPVRASFSNTGDRSVRAVFNGDARIGHRVISVLQSEEVVVGPGTSAELVAYFRPEDAGRYEISGRVNYNGKLTFEKGTILNVRAKRLYAWLPGTLVWLGYVLIVIAVLALLWVIKRERGKRRRW